MTISPRDVLLVIWVTVGLGAVGCDERPATGNDPIAGDTDVPPRWHYRRVAHAFPDRVFNDLYVDDRGNVTVVGQFGVIITNRGPQGTPHGVWTQMPSGTLEHITAITGLRNGNLFGLDPSDGEMFAVGWNGLLLHYHPNPDNNPATQDGAWSVVSSPAGASFTRVLPVDPACPDYDGDGIADDGDGSGFAGDAICVGGATTDCDDNCRTVPNGPMRPIVDAQPSDGCIGPGDGPEPGRSQIDADGDARGEVCDDDDDVAAPLNKFTAPLFDVFATRDGDEVQVIAVGGDGAAVMYAGPSAGSNAFTSTGGLTDASAWTALAQLPYRYDSDCPPGTPAGQSCGGRIAPSCPAICNPVRTTCSCPSNQGTCCDALASTGVGCADGSCGPAPNGCNPATGYCSALCPECFRRQGSTLRSVVGAPDAILAVGQQGSVLLGSPLEPTQAFTFPTCSADGPPKPLDDQPVLMAADRWGDDFVAVGSLGGIFFISPSRSGCAATEPDGTTNGGLAIESRRGAPAVVLLGVAATSRLTAVAVGDGGTVLLVTRGGVANVSDEVGVTQNLHAVWVGLDNELGDPSLGNASQMWIVGAGGTIIRAEYY